MQSLGSSWCTKGIVGDCLTYCASILIRVRNSEPDNGIRGHDSHCAPVKAVEKSYELIIPRGWHKMKDGEVEDNASRIQDKVDRVEVGPAPFHDQLVPSA